MSTDDNSLDKASPQKDLYCPRCGRAYDSEEMRYPPNPWFPQYPVYPWWPYPYLQPQVTWSSGSIAP